MTVVVSPGAFVGPRILYSKFVNVPLTGTTAETQLASITIPANSMGPAGRLRITMLFSATANANNKVFRCRFGGSSGQDYLGSVVGTVPSGPVVVSIYNTSATNVQGGGRENTLSATALVSAIDTTADTVVYISGTLAVGTDTATLISATVEVIPGV